jgi:HAD superfamily hydrolase (TIGR01509 family)
MTLTFCHGDRIAEVSASAGVNVTQESVEAAEPLIRRELAQFGWASTKTQERASRTSKPQGPAFYRRLLDLAKAVGPAATLDAAAIALWNAHLEKNLWCRVGVGVDAALGLLRAGGIKLAVVSNSEGTVEAMLNAVGLGRHMETVIDSWVVGVAKPDPGIFRIALDRLNVDARDAIMVGDTPSADIVGAQAAGIAAVLIDPLDLYPTAEVPRFTDVPAFVNALLAR